MLKISTTKNKIDEINQAGHPFDEKELVEKIKNSCTKSFQLIFMKYYETLYRFIWLRTHDSELARDLVQDMFIRVWDNRHRLDKNKSFKAYLYQISNNLVIDMMRRNKTKEKMLRINQSLNYYESEDQYYTSIDIQNAMNQLPEKLRIVVILSRFEGLSYMEIAEICGVSFQTVSYRLNQALKLMSKYLSDT
ncbi:RNA polymerase sigma factor [candidate division KSB1 bacterium]|nr:RNA polymerase sigma factor [candidate division KSB1 bacterium]